MHTRSKVRPPHHTGKSPGSTGRSACAGTEAIEFYVFNRRKSLTVSPVYQWVSGDLPVKTKSYASTPTRTSLPKERICLQWKADIHVNMPRTLHTRRSDMLQLPVTREQRKTQIRCKTSGGGVNYLYSNFGKRQIHLGNVTCATISDAMTGAFPKQAETTPGVS